ncbi:hypothetical protein COO60DRAFT_682155 [Scenedesmus sp. NREL 46B-D3]|nr:hypothetical protein COO60DRAFT_682155 [Scenedesmus sp. NREL 46B-D3]
MLAALPTHSLTHLGQLLSRLAQLPALEQLSLEYLDRRLAAAAAAATWPQLPQLCEPAICFLHAPSRQQWQATLKGIAASANLTKLQLEPGWLCTGETDGDEGEDATSDSPCAKLAGLANLKELSIENGRQVLAPGDALALTALTGLTRLALRHAGAGVGEAATATAGSCQQLHHLDLTGCNLVSMACLANVAHLTQLTELRLAGNSGLTHQGLMLLTALQRLQRFDVNRNAEVTDEVVERFWAAVDQH